MIKFIEQLLKPFNHMNLNDIAKQALDGEFLAGVLDEYLEWIIKENKLKEPTEEQILKMKEKVIKRLQEKYPDAGITLIKK